MAKKAKPKREKKPRAGTRTILPSAGPFVNVTRERGAMPDVAGTTARVCVNSLFIGYLVALDPAASGYPGNTSIQFRDGTQMIVAETIDTIMAAL